jgi:hemerythrin
LAEHKADHERLLDSLRDIVDGAYDAGDGTSASLVAALENWLTGHFSTHDVRLHRHLDRHTPS